MLSFLQMGLSMNDNNTTDHFYKLLESTIINHLKIIQIKDNKNK